MKSKMISYHDLGCDKEGKKSYKKAFNLTAEQVPSTDTPEWVNWVVNKVIEKLQNDE